MSLSSLVATSVSPSLPADALPATPPALAGAHFRHPIRVYWEDTDAGGIVVYGNYLKFMERARTEWFASLGFGQEDMRQSGEGMFVVADTQMRFLKPARLDDHLTVTVTVCEAGRSSVAFQQAVWRGETLLTQGQVRIAWVQSKAGQDSLRPGRMPQRIWAVLPTPIQTPGG